MNIDAGVTAVFGALIGVSLAEAFSSTTNEILSIAAASGLLFLTTCSVICSSFFYVTFKRAADRKEFLMLCISLLGAIIPSIFIFFIYGVLDALGSDSSSRTSFFVSAFLFIWVIIYIIGTVKKLKEA